MVLAFKKAFLFYNLSDYLFYINSVGDETVKPTMTVYIDNFYVVRSP